MFIQYKVFLLSLFSCEYHRKNKCSTYWSKYSNKLFKITKIHSFIYFMNKCTLGDIEFLITIFRSVESKLAHIHRYRYIFSGLSSSPFWVKNPPTVPHHKTLVCLQCKLSFNFKKGLDKTNRILNSISLLKLMIENWPLSVLTFTS